MQPSLMYERGLFVYDSIISFDLERRAVWSHNITGATALYLALRYVTLVTVIMYIIVYTVSSCEVSPHTVPFDYSS